MDGLVSAPIVFILPLFIVLSLFCMFWLLGAGGGGEVYPLESIVIGVFFDLFFW